MVISKFGVELILLNSTHLEMVRNWRNSELVNAQLINRQYISTEEQINWFKSIQNTANFYLVIKFKGVLCGLVYLSNIDWEQKNFESSIFIGEIEYHNSFVAFYAALIVSDLFFVNMSFNKAYSRVVRSNHNAAAFDSYLGFDYLDENKSTQNYSVKFATNESYKKASESIYKKMLRHKSKEACTVKFKSDNLEVIDNTIRQFLFNTAEQDNPYKILVTEE